jgi:UrcA family protein
MITGKHPQLSRRAWLLVGVAAGILGAASALAAPASASAGADANSVHVSYRDLNLATDAGNRALYQRITRAARQVCGVGDSRDLAVIAHSRACERDAVAAAVHTVNSPRLVAIYTQVQPRG